MSRRFQFSFAIIAAAMLVVGILVNWFERAADRRRLAEQARQVDALDDRMHLLAIEMDKLKADLQDRIRRMGQRPPRGKIEDTYDKVDAPNDFIEQ